MDGNTMIGRIVGEVSKWIGGHGGTARLAVPRGSPMASHRSVTAKIEIRLPWSSNFWTGMDEKKRDVDMLADAFGEWMEKGLMRDCSWKYLRREQGGRDVMIAVAVEAPVDENPLFGSEYGTHVPHGFRFLHDLDRLNGIAEALMEGISEMDSEAEIADDVILAPDNPLYRGEMSEGAEFGEGDSGEEIADDVILAPDNPAYRRAGRSDLMEKAGGGVAELPPVTPDVVPQSDPWMVIGEAERVEQVFMSMSDQEAIDHMVYVELHGWGRRVWRHEFGGLTVDELRARSPESVSEEEREAALKSVEDMISMNRHATPQEIAWYDVDAEVRIAADGVPPGEHQLEFGAQWGDPIPVILDISTRKPGKRQRNGRGVTIDVRDGFLVIGAKRGLAYYAMKHLQSETSYREFSKMFQKADQVSDDFGAAPQSDPHAVMEEFRRVREQVAAMDDEAAFDLLVRMEMERGSGDYEWVKARIEKWLKDHNKNTSTIYNKGRADVRGRLQRLVDPYLRRKVDAVPVGEYPIEGGAGGESLPATLRVVEKIPGGRKRDVWKVAMEGGAPVVLALRGHVADAMEKVAEGVLLKKTIGEGSRIPVEGVEHVVELHDGSGVSVEDGRILVPRSSADVPGDIKAHLMELCYERVKKWTDHYAAKVGGNCRKVFVESDGRFKESKTYGRPNRKVKRGGTIGLCFERSYRDKIYDVAYHWKLILCPPKFLEYLCAHECAHMKHMNHNMPFWNLVRKIMPDFEEWETRHNDTYWNAVVDYDFGDGD